MPVRTAARPRPGSAPPRRTTLGYPTRRSGPCGALKNKAGGSLRRGSATAEDGTAFAGRPPSDSNPAQPIARGGPQDGASQAEGRGFDPRLPLQEPSAAAIRSTTCARHTDASAPSSRRRACRSMCPTSVANTSKHSWATSTPATSPRRSPTATGPSRSSSNGPLRKASSPAPQCATCARSRLDGRRCSTPSRRLARLSVGPSLSWQSSGLLIRRSRVRIPEGPPPKSQWAWALAHRCPSPTGASWPFDSQVDSQADGRRRLSADLSGLFASMTKTKRGPRTGTRSDRSPGHRSQSPSSPRG